MHLKRESGSQSHAEIVVSNRHIQAKSVKVEQAENRVFFFAAQA
jgi:hypothetical protein